ncbi:MAG: hypothetical protein P4L81_05405 [Candidatus Pacebacteria bacterium]|nr:hypothetical protein [Candidatus Paceibacterota bacterium]
MHPTTTYARLKHTIRGSLFLALFRPPLRAKKIPHSPTKIIKMATYGKEIADGPLPIMSLKLKRKSVT